MAYDTWGGSWGASWGASWTFEQVVTDQSGRIETVGQIKSADMRGRIDAFHIAGQVLASQVLGRIK